MRRDDGVVCIVDDDADLGASLARLLQRHGYSARSFTDPAIFLSMHGNSEPSCIITDIMMGAIGGFDLARQLRTNHSAAAIIFMTAWPKTSDAVDAIRDLGGLDYLEKPLDTERLLHAVSEGLTWSRSRHSALARIGHLSPRERQVFDLMVRGKSNKMIAMALSVSVKTVEDHRAAVLKKTGAGTIADVIDIAGNIEGATKRHVHPSSNDR